MALHRPDPERVEHQLNELINLGSDELFDGRHCCIGPGADPPSWIVTLPVLERVASFSTTSMLPVWPNTVCTPSR